MPLRELECLKEISRRPANTSGRLLAYCVVFPLVKVMCLLGER